LRIQDGGARHLEFRKNVNNVRTDEAIFHQILIAYTWYQVVFDPLGQYAFFSKSKMAAAAILNFEKL